MHGSLPANENLTPLPIAAATVRGPIETAKLNGIDPQAHVADVLAGLVAGDPANRAQSCNGLSGGPRKTLLGRLTVLTGKRKAEIAKAAKRILASDATVPDGLGCFKALAEAGDGCREAVTGRGPQAAKWAAFKWVNTALGDAKGALTGTYRAVRPQHVPRSLAVFAHRFNRRFKLENMPARLGWVALRNLPMPYRCSHWPKDVGNQVWK